MTDSVLTGRSGWLRRGLCLLALGLASTWAQAELLFAVSEGASGAGAAATHRQMALKYQPLTEVMEQVLGQPVRVQYVRDFQALDAGMKEGRFDLVIARPADYPARGVRDYGYKAVTTRQVGVKCTLVVPKDASWQNLEDLGDLTQVRFIMPEQASYMASFCAAELREHGLKIDPARTYYVREQDAIPFSLQNKLAQVGGVGSGSNIFKDLEQQGLRILHTSREQPFLPLIAGARISADQVARLRQALVDRVASPEGAAQLAALGMKGFDTDPQPGLLAMLQWLEGSRVQ